MSDKDYYRILGVSESAAGPEIKKAYRRLAAKWHPDKNKSAEAEGRFKEINEAFQVLSDEGKRKEYDTFRKYGAFGGYGRGGGGTRGGAGGFGDMFGGAGGIDLGDLFGSMFGGGGRAAGGGGFGDFGGFGGQTATQTGRGGDIRATLQVPFDVALHGGSIDFRFTRDAACDTCGGTGAKPGTTPVTCGTCHGTGVVNLGAGGGFSIQRPCPACGGSGRVIETPCPTCHGRGTTQKTQTITVDIPKGVADGQSMRLAGLGHAGANGAAAGDLRLTLKVAAHPTFRREGRNLHADVRVDAIDAALGTTIDVPTVDGVVQMSIPPGTQPGATLRLRGKGVETKSGRGDQLVHITIVVPTSLTDAQRKILEQYRAGTPTG
jgi:molecular chaperone DnaJ